MTIVYFDCEFTGLTKNCDLISIGLISESGQGFYAEFMDYDEKKILDRKWMNANVINNLFLKDYEDSYKELRLDNRIYSLTFIRDDSYWVKKRLLNWFINLSKFNLKDNEIQLYSDCCHFDFVLFLSLFGSALDLPKFISPVCHDINFDIARYLGISEADAFDISREKLSNSFNDELIDNLEEIINYYAKVSQHNSFSDALEIAKIERGIRRFS